MAGIREVSVRLGSRASGLLSPPAVALRTSHAAVPEALGGRCRSEGRAPGRSRTDTGDPFRGPASSLGLRGLGHDTPVGPNHSCSGEWGEKNSPGFTYAIHGHDPRMRSVTNFASSWKHCVHSVAGR